MLLRRTGIPISLSVLYMTLARKLGVQLEPVNFPNHFLLRWCQKPRGYGLKLKSFEIFLNNDTINSCVVCCIESIELSRFQGFFFHKSQIWLLFLGKNTMDCSCYPQSLYNINSLFYSVESKPFSGCYVIA